MYDDLYNAWRRELENVELERLPPDFYMKIADYLKRLKEESRMLDKRTMKASLLEGEMRNVRRMLRELIQLRYIKLVRRTSGGQKVSSELLTVEEGKIRGGILPLAEAYQRFVKGLLQGHVAKVEIEKAHKRAVLRFSKDVPAIIGADMKTYGPFKVEDVASVPVENAKVLVKQGLAQIIEVT